MHYMPWQVTRPCNTTTSCPGERIQPVYEVTRDRYTGEASLKQKDSYDIQELTDSYAENADPVTMIQRVRIGEIEPWNGEDTLDTRQLPKAIREVPEYIAGKVESMTANRASQIAKYIKDQRPQPNPTKEIDTEGGEPNE